MGSRVDLPVALTRYFESAEQVITSAGSLTLAHGLGVKPTHFLGVIVCKTAEQGYSVNDEVPVPIWNFEIAATGTALQIVPDASNINVRYGSRANVFIVNNFTTGAQVALTNANWRLKVRAWA